MDQARWGQEQLPQVSPARGCLRFSVARRRHMSPCGSNVCFGGFVHNASPKRAASRTATRVVADHYMCSFEMLGPDFRGDEIASTNGC